MMQFLKKKPYIWFLLPGFVLYSIFIIYPIFAAGQLSLYHWNGIGEKVFVGFQNYIDLFTNKDLMSQMINALKHSLTIFALTVCIAMPVQIIMAYMVYSKARGRQLFSGCDFFAPVYFDAGYCIHFYPDF